MKLTPTIITFLTLLLSAQSPLHGQDMDKEISSLATNLATTIKNQEKKKVAVIDFTDLEGASSELGKYVAEQLTVDLVNARQKFFVLDRANLRKVLAEHKLTVTGLVDPENAKKLGQFEGVDAIILGTVTPKNQTISVTAKIITTDTAEIVGAARATFKQDVDVQQLLARPTTELPATDNADTPKRDRPAIVKSFGDLRVELKELRIVNGTQYQLTMQLSNQNHTKSIWVALQANSSGQGPNAHLTDSAGFECPADGQRISGIQIGSINESHADPFYSTPQERLHPHWQFRPALELRPGEETATTLRFHSSAIKAPEPGPCTLQIELLVGHDFIPGAGIVKTENLVTKLEATQ